MAGPADLGPAFADDSFADDFSLMRLP